MKKYFLLILLSAVLLYNCSSKEEKPHEEHEEAAASVTLHRHSIEEAGIISAEVSESTFNGVITAPAKIITNPDEEAIVGSLVKGRVKRVFVNPGQPVKQGQPLMELEGLEIGEIKSAYRKAKAQLDFAEASYKRQKSLNEQKVASEKSLIESKAEYDKALADFKAEDEKIHSIGLSDTEALDNSSNHSSGVVTVKSPIAGVISERNVIIGQLVDESATAFRIINTSALWAEAQVNEKDIAQINRASSGVFTTGSIPAALFNAKIFFISQIVDEKTRTIPVRAAVSNIQGKLKPQMFGELQINTGRNSSAIFIPAEAVIKLNGDDCVFTRPDDTTFVKTPVIIGAHTADKVEVKEGLRLKERVVVKGAFYLKSVMMKGEIGGHEH